MRVFAKEQVVFWNNPQWFRQLAVFELDANGTVKQRFLVIPGLLVINYTEIGKLYGCLYRGTFDSSDFK